MASAPCSARERSHSTAFSGAVILCLHTTNNAKFHIGFLLNLFRAGHSDLAGPLSIIM